MGQVFFCAENVIVSSEAITVDGRSSALTDLRGVRARRIRRWLLPSYEVVLARVHEKEVVLLRHRDCYFTFQLVRAIESALSAQRGAEHPAPAISA